MADHGHQSLLAFMLPEVGFDKHSKLSMVDISMSHIYIYNIAYLLFQQGTFDLENV